ncbi:hypothetical protein [Moritella viscosa]|uniref:Uncharacterized protein n=1 Tax=Moritella viscosa TaxID=80854 RepID=A0ABY1HI88_9GAMM|nr:hypothetical protein [Moritella viscosa]SGZ00568.1 Putative uncharacterized protein [Moritella viscosa]
MNRVKLIERLSLYKGQTEIGHALEILAKSDNENVNNQDLGDIAERVSVSIDHKFSADENHPMCALEIELSQAYKRT